MSIENDATRALFALSKDAFATRSVQVNDTSLNEIRTVENLINETRF
jgi:hypothetical protein